MQALEASTGPCLSGQRILRSFTLWIQLPSQKIFNLLKTSSTTFLEGIWIPRLKALSFLGVDNLERSFEFLLSDPLWEN